MRSISKFIIFILIAGDLILLGWFLLNGKNIALFNPKGIIALSERNVIIISVLLMLIAVVPAYFLLFIFARKYRENKAENISDTKHHKFTLLILWGLPSAVVFVLAVLNWKNTHSLDPYKSINTAVTPLTIQVVALQWRWLFIYPKQHIAAVNFVEFPKQTSIHFEMTTDNAPMNLFWIPQLGGQMAAMAGMVTQHNLIANDVGEFAGSAAEMNGRGFAGMRFIAKSVTQDDFNSWVQFVQASPHILNSDEYKKLVQPSENNIVVYYASIDNNLYNEIVMKYMAPISPTMSGMQKMNMQY